MIEIGYWKTRCLVGSIRLILEYTDEEWIETLYDTSLPENADRNDYYAWDRSQWYKEKNSEYFQKNYSFPNLPWMKDGNVHLTQSTAIVKYIARKHNIGQTLNESEHCRLDQGIEEIIDVRDDFIYFCYGSGLKRYRNWKIGYYKE